MGTFGGLLEEDEQKPKISFCLSSDSPVIRRICDKEKLNWFSNIFPLCFIDIPKKLGDPKTDKQLLLQLVKNKFVLLYCEMIIFHNSRDSPLNIVGAWLLPDPRRAGHVKAFQKSYVRKYVRT